MNRFKEHRKEKQPDSRKKSFATHMRKAMGFTSQRPSKNAVVLSITLCILGIIYIMNAYRAEKKAIEINKLTNENKELRAEYLLLKSKRMYYSSQGNLARKLQERGVKEAMNPPIKVTKKRDE